MLTSARIVLFTALIGIAPAGLAQVFPSKPIRLIVPFPTGGSADNLARMMQAPLSEVLGQPIVIDNRPGASGTIGTDLAAKAQPDGHTILLVTTTYTVNPSLMKKLPFDPLKDLAPVSLVVSQANILAVHPSVPAQTVRELVALAKAKPNTLNFAGGGNGSSPHLSGELLKIVAGIQITHVPYKGSGPGVTDLIGGHVHMMFAGPLAFERHVKAGRLRALAVTGKKRSPILPHVPTMAEAGYPGIETGTWFAILAPSNTPKAAIDALYHGVLKVLHDPDLASRFTKQGIDVVGGGPAELGRHMEAEITKWGKLVRQAGITLD